MKKIVALSILTALALNAETLEVCKSGCEYDSLQEAIEIATNGDTVRLGEGIYHTGVRLNKCVSIQGAGKSKSIIAPINENGIVYMNLPENIECRISLSDLQIKGGQGRNGGGVFLFYNAYKGAAKIALKDVDIVGCSALYNGGGIYMENKSSFGTMSVTMENVRIQGNSAGEKGGGVYIFRAQTDMKNTIVSGNDAREGGGIYYQLWKLKKVHPYSLDMESVIVESNSATKIGGGVVLNGNGTIRRSWIVENTTQGDGGGLYVMWWKYLDYATTSCVVENSIIANNRAKNLGGGAYITGDYSATLKNSTILANLSRKKQDDITLISKENGLPLTFKSLNNAIGAIHFRENKDNRVDIDYLVKYSAITKVVGLPQDELLGSANNIQVDNFGYVDPKNNDFTLRSDSPLIGRADSASATLEDIGSQPRDAHPDIGAVEYPHEASLDRLKNDLFDQKPLVESCSEGYAKGFEDGKKFCQENPQACGIEATKKEWDTTPKEQVVAALKNRAFPLAGYYVHYGDGLFDWIYVSKELGLVAKLEEGSNEDGTLRWTFIQTSKNSPVFESIELKSGKIIFGNIIEVPGGK